MFLNWYEFTNTFDSNPILESSYVLLDNEPVLVKEILSKIHNRAHILGYDKKYFSSKTASDWIEIFSFLKNISIFNTGTLIILRDSITATNSNIQMLMDCIYKINAQLKQFTLVLTISEIDYNSTVFNTLSEIGLIIQTKLQNRKDLKKWIEKKIKQQNQSTTESFINTFSKYGIQNLAYINEKIEKIGLLYPGQILTEENIDIENVSKKIKNYYDFHDLKKHILCRNQEGIVEVIFGMKEQSFPLTLILFSLIKVLSSIIDDYSKKSELSKIKSRFFLDILEEIYEIDCSFKNFTPVFHKTSGKPWIDLINLVTKISQNIN